MQNTTGISILDCTLRDGGYVNNWKFDNRSIISIINSLVDSKVEIIECGFVSQRKGFINNSSLFDDFSTINSLLLGIHDQESEAEFVAMTNYTDYDWNLLPQKSEKSTPHINGIRLAFHKRDIDGAYDAAAKIIEKGYKVYIQPMVTLAYSDNEIISMISKFNQLNIHALYIVDSFGAMYGEDFKRLHFLFDHNLKAGVSLGYHAHNNLQMAYSNAIDFLAIKNNNRKIVIDSSILGMGRGAGNLNTDIDYSCPGLSLGNNNEMGIAK